MKIFPSLKGLSICLTGQGPMLRADIAREVERNGGQVESIGKGTNLLVTNSRFSRSRKMKLAEQYNIPVMDYGEFFYQFKIGDYKTIISKDINITTPQSKQILDNYVFATAKEVEKRIFKKLEKPKTLKRSIEI